MNQQKGRFKIMSSGRPEFNTIPERINNQLYFINNRPVYRAFTKQRMGTKNTLAIRMIILQLAGISHVWYAYLYKDGQIPHSFIELNILALFSIGVLALFRFKYYKPGEKTGLWLLSISISFLVILLLTISYILMGIDKYS